MLRGCPCTTSRNNPYSLSKYSRPRTLSSPKANIVLPQGNIQVPLSTIFKHVPGGYEKFRSANLGRNIDPLQDLRLFISNGEDLEVVELAMQWIFSHVKFDKTLECPYHMRTMPSTENPLEKCMDEMRAAYGINDTNHYMLYLEFADKILKAVCFILQGPWFTGSMPVTEALNSTVLKLIPLYTTAQVDASALFDLIKSVGKAVVDMRALGQLINQLPLNDRQDVKHACGQMAQMGDPFAIKILPYI